MKNKFFLIRWLLILVTIITLVFNMIKITYLCLVIWNCIELRKRIKATKGKKTKEDIVSIIGLILIMLSLSILLVAEFIK